MAVTTSTNPEKSMKRAVVTTISGEATAANMTETRKLNSENLRQLCIKNDWYTRGNNEEYGKLLGFVDSCDNVTTADIVKIATDIICHSDTDHTVSSICFEIARICYSFFE